MYIEVLHDNIGNINHCYCVDTMPVIDGSAFFTCKEGVPGGLTQARINIDTIIAMEIEAGSGQKAMIDPVTGLPFIIFVSRSEYIIQNFLVDMNNPVIPPIGILLPAGMGMKGLTRKV